MKHQNIDVHRCCELAAAESAGVSDVPDVQKLLSPVEEVLKGLFAVLRREMEQMANEIELCLCVTTAKITECAVNSCSLRLSYCMICVD